MSGFYVPIRGFRYISCMALIGYARVSTRDQNLDAQIDLLKEVGCERIFTEHASGALTQRRALAEALDYLREDDVLIVTKLDRLGRSVKHLKEVLDDLAARKVHFRALSPDIDTSTPFGWLLFHVVAAVAEFERDLTVERTHEGLKSARARGRIGGRKTKMGALRTGQARSMYESGDFTVSEIASTFEVSRSTIYRALEREAKQATTEAGSVVAAHESPLDRTPPEVLTGRP